MGRALLVLWNDATRAKAIDWIRRAPPETRVTFQGPKRSTEQSDKMWACLTDISQQTDWCGLKLSPEDWKVLFMNALNSEMRLVPNLDKTGYVNLGNRSSQLSKAEMADLIEIIYKFAAERGIKLYEPGAAHALQD
jgi:hypothetical protein